VCVQRLGKSVCNVSCEAEEEEEVRGTTSIYVGATWRMINEKGVGKAHHT